MSAAGRLRIGLDLGGTKTEVAVLDAAGAVRLRRRAPSVPDYAGTLRLCAELVGAAEAECGAAARVGAGIPGSLSPSTGLVRGANSTWLNGQPMQRDLAAALGRPVAVANDANCLALAEAGPGGAGEGCATIFAAILGTGVGGGLVAHGRLLEGRNRIAGEWGHLPLPWKTPAELQRPPCWCGRRGCIETYLSGPALAADADGPGMRDAGTLQDRAADGDAAAAGALQRWVERLARALAIVIDVFDPDCLVLGGGLSNLDLPYAALPSLLPQHVFSDACTTPIRRAALGDSAGVLGAARL